MSPAFSSPRQAVAFALLLLILLLSPLLVGESQLPPREQSYLSLGWGSGPYPYLYQQLFVEKEDIDIAFIGSSHMWNGIATTYVQQKLSEKLGRKAVVRSLCWGGAGYDALYFITQDLLRHRKVRMLVYYDDYNEKGARNNMAPYWFRYPENASALEGLPLQNQAGYYFAAILGIPQNLLNMVRPNIPASMASANEGRWKGLPREDYASELGAMTLLVSWNHSDFTVFRPAVKDKASAVCVYSPENAGMFQFTGPRPPAWQIHFAKKFIAESARPVLLHIPVADEVHSLVISERMCWPEALNAKVCMLGIAPSILFGGLGDDSILDLYSDRFHLNKNGQEYFTSVITPRLFQIYDSLSPR